MQYIGDNILREHDNMMKRCDIIVQYREKLSFRMLNSGGKLNIPVQKLVKTVILRKSRDINMIN